MRRVLLGLVIPVGAVLIWSVAAGSGVIPSPADVIAAGGDLAQRGELLRDVAASNGRAMRGFAVGALAGTLLGGLATASRLAGELLTPAIRALRAVPSVALLPLLLFTLGIGEATTVTAVAMAVALPVFAAVSGARAEVAAVFAGLRQGLAQSWLILVAAELLTATVGIGRLLVASGGAGRVDRVVVAVAVVAVLAIVTDLLLGVAERLARRITSDTATLVRNTDHL